MRLPALFLLLSMLASAAAPRGSAAQNLPRVVIQTSLGGMEVEVDTVRAPRTSHNFLRYVDQGSYRGGRFHRTVRLDNQADKRVKIQVIQGGLDSLRAKDFPPIELERTTRHRPLTPGWYHLHGPGRARHGHVGFLHLHRRSAGAGLRREAKSRWPGLRRLRESAARDGRRARRFRRPGPRASSSPRRSRLSISRGRDRQAVGEEEVGEEAVGEEAVRG